MKEKTMLEEMLTKQEFKKVIELSDQLLEIDSQNLHTVCCGITANIFLEDTDKARELWLSFLLGSDLEGTETASEILIFLLESTSLANLEFKYQQAIADSYTIMRELDQAYKNEQIEQFLSSRILAFIVKAEQFIFKEQYEQAINQYLQILQLSINNWDVWNRLALAYYQMGSYEQALDLVEEAIAYNPEYAEFYHTRGVIYESQKEVGGAIISYQKAINCNSININTYNNLGNLYQIRGDFEKAESLYIKGIQIKPKSFNSYLNLGKLSVAQGNYKTAISYYKKALSIEYYNSTIHYQMGCAEEQNNNPIQAHIHYAYQNYYESNYHQAISHFETCLEHPDAPELIYFHTADCYYKLNKTEQSILIYYQGLKKYPASELLYQRLIYALHNTDRIYEAFTEVDNAIRNTKNVFLFQSQKLLLLPILYGTKEEIEICRCFYEKNLNELISIVNSLQKNEKLIPDDVTQLTNTFYLQYQSKNDTNLQAKYAELIYKLLTNHFQESLPVGSFLNKTKPKIRIGYFSNCFRFHTVAALMVGWFKYQDRSKYEIYCYYYDTRNNLVDPMTRTFQSYSDHFVHFKNSDLVTVVEQLRQDKLDILVYLDVGMVPISNYLASIRLAPIQCTTWGHPITSGSPVMDYFLSSDLMEPDNAFTHYSETLIRLPNMGIVYAKPTLPDQEFTRRYFDLLDNSLIYFCAQSLFKYLPQFDYIYPEIVQQVPNAMFVFIVFNANSVVTDKFWQRIQRVFQLYDLDANQYVRVLPRLSGEEFLGMNLVADCFLDSFGWSGGKTTLDALACSLPVITCPGEFMRGRHAYGILKMLGITETIAIDEAEYIELAIRLAHDSAWRASLKSQIKKNIERLYDDLTAIRGLESFYEKAIECYPDRLAHFS